MGRLAATASLGRPEHASVNGAAWSLVIGLALLVQLVAASAQAQPGCTAKTSLLRDARFRTLNPGGSSLWVATQHAGDPAFMARVDDPVLAIEKTGDEPWILYAQRIVRGDLAGRRVRFSASLRFDVEEPTPSHKFDYVAGLSLIAKNRGRRRILSSSADHTPNFGQTDWVDVAVEVDLPPTTAAVEAGFIHQAGGTLYVKNPRLHFFENGRCVR